MPSFINRTLFFVLLIFPIPLYWTADKILQIYATSVIEGQVLKNIHSPSFLSGIFNLSTPLVFSKEIYFSGATFGAASKSNNRLRDFINGQGIFEINKINPPTREFVAYLSFVDGLGKVDWYFYDVKLCGREMCKYEEEKLLKVSNVTYLKDSSAELRQVVKGEHLGYRIDTVYYLYVMDGNQLSGLTVSILNEGLNPLDNMFRQLLSSTAPNYWYEQWNYQEDFVTGSSIMESN